MFITIINDCHDGNARARQTARAAALFGVTPAFVGVAAYKEIEAAGNLVDMLDAADGQPGVILVNVAPRSGRGKKWPNGTPFCYFYVGKTLVVSSLDDVTLSLVKKFGLAKDIHLVDIETVTGHMVKDKFITEEVRQRIVCSQFRSYEYVPRVAKYIWDSKNTGIGELIKEEDIVTAPRCIWWVDNFGNCKTTLLAEDLGDAPTVKTSWGEFSVFKQLKDVPDNATAFITGSSGYGKDRFVELVVQGASAASVYSLATGDPVTVY